MYNFHLILYLTVSTFYLTFIDLYLTVYLNFIDLYLTVYLNFIDISLCLCISISLLLFLMLFVTSKSFPYFISYILFISFFSPSLSPATQIVLTAPVDDYLLVCKAGRDYTNKNVQILVVVVVHFLFSTSVCIA